MRLYLTLTRLASGAFGAVFRSAVNGWTGTTVAVKILKSTTADEVASFMEEAKLLASLHHDNIVGFRGMCQLDGNTSLVMECVSGGSLSGQLGAGASPGMDAGEKAAAVTDVAKAMAYLHAQTPAILHRDLKQYPGRISQEQFRSCEGH